MKIKSSLSSIRRFLARRTPIQRRVEKAITIPGLPQHKTQAGSVWAVTMVRDEADIIGHSIRHLLHQGVDGVIVLDNLSTDETPAVLDRLARAERRVFQGTYELNEFHQGRVMSYLAHAAGQAGAEWVVLFDADEFWFAETGTVAGYLASRDRKTDVVQAAVHDAHPIDVNGIDLTSMNERVRLDERPASKKVAVRPRRWVWVDAGNHTALDLGKAQDFGLRIAHVPYRNFNQYERKVTQGASALAAAGDNVSGSHWRAESEAGPEFRRVEWRRRIRAGDGEAQQLPALWDGWPLQ